MKMGIKLVKNILYSRYEPFILMYHRIIEDIQDEPFPVQPGMYVSVRNFEDNLIQLNKKFKIVSLLELLDRVFSDEPLANYCSITFDDGWEDNFHCAFPLLLKHHAPASFFLSTSMVGTNNWFWFDEVAFFLNKSDIDQQLDVFSRNSSSNRIIMNIKKKRQPIEEKITDIVYEIKNGYSIADRERLIQLIKSSNRLSIRETKKMLDWDQIVTMHSSGLADFYSHSHTHENLDKLEGNHIYFDIQKSLDCISSHLKMNNSRIFCYPSGKYDETMFPILQTLGIDYAVTTERGFVNNTHKYKVNRIGIHNDISRNIEKILRKA